MEIRKCTVADYPEFLNILNEVFGYGRTREWFQKDLPQCTPYPNIVTIEEIQRHWLCIIDGRIAGGLGAYPLDWVVCDAKGEERVISIYGIGQVCCLPEYRNQGVMSALMKAAEDEMYNLGRTVGYLHGDRRRYGYFGYDFAGNMVSYHMDYKLLQLAASPNVTIRAASLEDWQEIDTVYRTQPSYIKRSTRYWEMQFARECVEWFIGECNGNKGYMCVQHGNISEAYGDPCVVAAMFVDRANGLEEGKTLSVTYGAQDIITTPVGQMIYTAAEGVRSNSAGLFAVKNVEKMLDELEVGHIGLSPDDKEDMARQLINFAPLPKRVPNVQPICAWISGVDSI